MTPKSLFAVATSNTANMERSPSDHLSGILIRETTPVLTEGRLSQLDEESSSDDELCTSLCSLASSQVSSSSGRMLSGIDVRCHNSSRQDFRVRSMKTNSNVADESAQQSLSLMLQLDNTPQAPIMATDSEVDSREAMTTRSPLHVVRSLDDLPAPVTIRPNPVTPRKPKLTLSAFRRPEQTVRLTDCDPTRLLENEYNLRAAECRVIGHGAFSTVRLAISYSNGEKVAIKSISKFDALRARRLRSGSRNIDEWEIMRLLQDNPYVLRLLDVFETNEEIHLVTEYCEGGELFDAIKKKGSRLSSFRRGRYSEAQAARITNQLLRALVELHGHGIVHRDIKPENILLLNNDESDIQVKLADFGTARSISAESSNDGESSPSTPGLAYATNSPPEISKRGASGPEADVYSLGVTLYILLCGFPPVFCNSEINFPDAYWADISDEAKDVVRGMVHPDPQKRVSVRTALMNPWVRQHTTRVRRGSISANLELVRSRLFKSLGDSCQPENPKRRRGSIANYSPKRQRRMPMQVSISMSDLYSVSEKGDVRVIEERIETRPEVDERSSQQ